MTLVHSNFFFLFALVIVSNLAEAQRLRNAAAPLSTNSSRRGASGT